MDIKGKAKAAGEGEDEEPDDDLAYLTARKRTYVRPITPVRDTSPFRELSDVSENDSDEEGNAPKKKRRKKRPPPQRRLPEWTRQGSTESGRKRSVGRGSTEERINGGPIVIDDSDDDGKGKGKAVNGRKRIELTPPPELSEARKAELRAAMERHFAPEPVIDINLDEESILSQSYTPETSTSSSVVNVIVTVRMVADPQRAAAGASANAIRAYQRGRQITIRRDQPLSVVYRFLAQQINKEADEIVLVHNGQKIYSSSVTARSLRMASTVELTGFELAHWERMEREKQRERRLLLVDGSSPLKADRSPSPDVDTIEPLAEPVRANKIRLSLRGKWGEFRMNVIGETTALMLVKWYCSKAGKDQSEAEGLRLEFDGEKIEPGAMVRDLEVEDRDLLDVI